MSGWEVVSKTRSLPILAYHLFAKCKGSSLPIVSSVCPVPGKNKKTFLAITKPRRKRRLALLLDLTPPDKIGSAQSDRQTDLQIRFYFKATLPSGRHNHRLATIHHMCTKKLSSLLPISINSRRKGKKKTYILDNSIYKPNIFYLKLKFNKCSLDHFLL